KIIKAYFKVYNTLRYGFLEKVYENALGIELRKQGLNVMQQHPIRVRYERELVGEYFADLIVEGSVILELKASASLLEEHEHQLLNYLKATNKEVGLLFNFGREPAFRRKVFMNE